MAAKKKKAASKKPAPLPTFATVKELLKGYAKGTISRRKHKLKVDGDQVCVEFDGDDASGGHTHVAFEMDVGDFVLDAAKLLKIPTE